MTPIDRLSPLSPAQASQSFGASPADAARDALGQIGHRVIAWVDAVAPAGGSARGQWASLAGAADGFRPDAGELARGGDVYGLRGLTDGLSAQFGATPAQSGELHRALEDFTRAAVVHVAGLQGAPADRQVAALAAALDVPVGGAGIDGVIDGIGAAGQRLSAPLDR